MTDQEIIETYALRKMTIRQLARKIGRSYEYVRKILVKAGYHNGLK